MDTVDKVKWIERRYRLCFHEEILSFPTIDHNIFTCRDAPALGLITQRSLIIMTDQNLWPKKLLAFDLTDWNNGSIEMLFGVRSAVDYSDQILWKSQIQKQSKWKHG